MSTIIHSKIFLAPHLYLFPSWTPVNQRLNLLLISHSFLRLSPFFFNSFSLLFKLDISIDLSLSPLAPALLSPFCSWAQHVSLFRLLYFSVLKFPFGSSLYLLCACRDFLVFYLIQVCLWLLLEHFIIASLKSLPGNSNIHVTHLCNSNIQVTHLWHLLIVFSYSDWDFPGSLIANNFGLYPGLFEHYVIRFWVLFKFYGEWMLLFLF